MTCLFTGELLEASLVLSYLPAVQEVACDAGDPGPIPGLGRSSGEGNGNLLQYSCLENPMEEELAGYSPWGCKESEMTEGTWHTCMQGRNAWDYDQYQWKT